MRKKLYKVWSNSLKKAVLAASFNELIVEGAKKLQLENEIITTYLEDGTDLDSEEIFQALPAGTIVYLLTDRDKKPWEEDKLNYTELPSSSSRYLPSFSSRNLPSSSKALDSSSNVQQTSSENFQAETSIKTNPQIFSPVKGFKVHRAWPSSFLIPIECFSDELKKGLDCGDLTWAMKNELLSHLSRSIQVYTPSPTVVQRDIVARELIKQFPNLKSNIGEGHEGWTYKIYDRMKHDAQKKTFNHKRKVERHELNWRNKKIKLENEGVLENNDALFNAKEEMEKEMNKPPSKRLLLKGASKVSFNDQKKLNSNLSLKRIEETYPAYFTHAGILYDFEFAYNCNLKELIISRLSACSSEILKFAERKKINKINLEEFNLPVSELIQAILLIPKILRENSDYLVKFSSGHTVVKELEESIITPHMCVIGGPSSSEIYLVAEKNIIECCNFIEGITSLIGLYFTANIEFPKEAVATYTFFQSYVLKLSCKKLPGKLITFCKSLP